MNLSFFELERARRDPKKVASAKLRKFAGLKPTFPMYWMYAAKLYHKLMEQNDVDAETQAVQYLSQHCIAKLSGTSGFEEKLLTYSRKLENYFERYTELKRPTIQTNKRVHFDSIFGHFVSGKVARLDMIPSGGFAVTNFETHTSDWKGQLRIPIIQRAVADELRCSTSDVQVGIYCMETEKHDYVTCSNAQVNAAIKELQVILAVIEAEVNRLRHDNH